MKVTTGYLFILICYLFSFQATAQEKSAPELYAGFQFWARYNHQNPGSTIGGEPSDHAVDISIRRYRFGVRGSLDENINYHFQLGNNNLSNLNPDKAPKLLDAYIDWKLGDHISLVFGKHAWTGLSRYAAPSTFSAMGTDINFSAAPFLNIQDDFFRRFGLAAHGTIGKLDYRAVLARPNANSTAKLGPNANFINDASAVHTSAYFKYQFLDKESLASPFSAWTYHGKKQLLNLGFGFSNQTRSTSSISRLGDTTIHDARSFAFDIFYERPAFDKMTLTYYTALIHHDLGPDFIRNIGPNNTADGSDNHVSYNGTGNSFPSVGSGNILLSQIALMKYFNTKKEKPFAIQTFFTLELAQLDALNEQAALYEFGLSYLLDSHKSKLSLSVQDRPIFRQSGGMIKQTDHREMVILQYQIRI
ncbi:MAG: hypothetical protein ACJAVY_001176 [Marinoscillum sp.]|jgi:hypothetical protein